MAEELRHGYQMLHLLLEEDWSSVSDQSGPDMVEEILSMQTGSHVLGAFNIDFDSFVDNITFCCPDRPGRQVPAGDAAESAPTNRWPSRCPRCCARRRFHLATGVVPMRRWVGPPPPWQRLRHHRDAAEGDQQVAAARPRDVRRRARRRLQRADGLQADEERRGPGPVLQRGRRSW